MAQGKWPSSLAPIRIKGHSFHDSTRSTAYPCVHWHGISFSSLFSRPQSTRNWPCSCMIFNITRVERSSAITAITALAKSGLGFEARGVPVVGRLKAPPHTIGQGASPSQITQFLHSLVASSSNELPFYQALECNLAARHILLPVKRVMGAVYMYTMQE